MSDLLISRGLKSLQDLHGRCPAEFEKQAESVANFLERAELGRLVRASWPGQTPDGAPFAIEQFLDRSVDILDLSVRSSHCLSTAEITTIGQLAGWSAPQLLSIKNMGAKSLQEIQEKLARLRSGETSLPDQERPPLAADPESFCLGVLVALTESGIHESILSRLRKSGIARMDDLVTRNLNSLCYWVGLSESEVLSLQQQLHRRGLALNSCLPRWLRFHFEEITTAFEGDIERLVEAGEGDIAGPEATAVVGVPACLEEELETFFRTDVNKRNKEIARRFLGWDGGSGTTLEQAGMEFQLTRERVRQIVAKSLRPANVTKSIFLKVAVDYIDRRVPRYAEIVEAELVEFGILRSPLRLEVIRDAAVRFEVPVSWMVLELNLRRVLGNAVALNRIQEFLTVARRKVSHFGVTRAKYVLAELIDKPVPDELTLSLIRR